MIVAVGPGLKGICAPLHYSDFSSSSSQGLEEGTEGTFLVLSVEPSQRKMSLTMKKSLVNSNLPRFSSYEEIKPG